MFRRVISCGFILLAVSCRSVAFTASVGSRDEVITSSTKMKPVRIGTPARNTKLQLSGNVEQLQATPQVDFDAIIKYHGAIAIQMSCFSGIFFALDAAVGAIEMDIPFPVLVALFYAISLKSRVLNPLNNQRPKLVNAVQDGPPSKGFRDRIMPSWTPPGPVFPIMWLLIIGPLRAYSSALVYTETHAFLHPAIMALIFHLSVGDVWNTINNTERRFGAAVTGVLCVTASALNVAYQYHGVSKLAGDLVGLPLIWFAVATSLVTATWQVNPDEVTGDKDALYPIVGQSKTTFAWFATKDE
jgi:translocator protein